MNGQLRQSGSAQPQHSGLRHALAASSSRPATPSSTTNERGIAEANPSPPLLTSLSANDGESVLCIAIESDSSGLAKYVYAGSQGGHIHVWDARTYVLRAQLSGHDGAVLSLVLVQERQWLISSSGDGTIRVWHTPSLTPLYLIHPPNDNVGDILSMAWLPAYKLAPTTSGKVDHHLAGRLFAGCQDTSIQWVDLPPSFQSPGSHPSHHHSNDFAAHVGSSGMSFSPPIHKAPNKFFDSLNEHERPRSRLQKHSASAASLSALAMEVDLSTQSAGTAASDNVVELQFENEHIEHYAHYGYVYCLTLAKSSDEVVLVSGSGDESLKVWNVSAECLINKAVLESTCDAVLAIAARESTVYAGHQGGIVKIWDLDTFECIRSLRTHSSDILSISIIGNSFWTASASGVIQHYDAQFAPHDSWKAHEGIALASVAHESHLITAGNDALLKVWDLSADLDAQVPTSSALGFRGQLYHTLSKFVSIKTIANSQHREDCRQGAQFLKSALRDMGAQASLLPGEPAKNPIVFATFKANSRSPPKKRVLFYGHYDVVAPGDSEQWKSDPFVMTGKDGWLYGRGVSDNKGPILSVAAAASELRSKQSLEVDLVMLVEGEEETGSAGFQAAVRKHKEAIGDIDVVLVANSYWLEDDLPCLTFGLRGVVHASITVSSEHPDLHSGIYGGVVNEPLLDLVRVLASLTGPTGQVQIPDFLKHVKPLRSAEDRLYDAIIERCHEPSRKKLSLDSSSSDLKDSLIKRWRQPALSVHDVQVSGSSHKSLIPSWAKSAVSIRTVPDQPLEEIVDKLKKHIEQAFHHLETKNQLSVEIDHVADWWLGDVDSAYFSTLSDCIEAAWGVKPLYIREGGSIPSLPFLQREFAASAVHFPMGTSSDCAHLPNERMRVLNLENGKAILQDWLSRLPSI